MRPGRQVDPHAHYRGLSARAAFDVHAEGATAMMDEPGKGPTSKTPPADLVAEDVGGVQGTEPDDSQDAAVALGTAPPADQAEPFIGGGEMDWAGLEEPDEEMQQ